MVRIGARTSLGPGKVETACPVPGKAILGKGRRVLRPAGPEEKREGRDHFPLYLRMNNTHSSPFKVTSCPPSPRSPPPLPPVATRLLDPAARFLASPLHPSAHSPALQEARPDRTKSPGRRPE